MFCIKPQMNKLFVPQSLHLHRPEEVRRVGERNTGSAGRGSLTYLHPCSGRVAEQVPNPSAFSGRCRHSPPGRETQAHREHRPWASLGPGHALCRCEDPRALRIGSTRHFWGASTEVEEGGTLDPSCLVAFPQDSGPGPATPMYTESLGLSRVPPTAKPPCEPHISPVGKSLCSE